MQPDIYGSLLFTSAYLCQLARAYLSHTLNAPHSQTHHFCESPGSCSKSPCVVQHTCYVSSVNDRGSRPSSCSQSLYFTDNDPGEVLPREPGRRCCCTCLMTCSSLHLCLYRPAFSTHVCTVLTARAFNHTANSSLRLPCRVPLRQSARLASTARLTNAKPKCAMHMASLECIACMHSPPCGGCHQSQRTPL